MGDQDTPAEQRHTTLREMCADFMELAVNCGIINAVIEQYPETVQRGFQERLEEIHEWVNEQTRQVQEFGSAYDPD